MGRDHSCDVCGTGGFNSDHDWQRHAVLVEEALTDLAKAGRQLVNAGLPPDLDTERPFWVAARNMRATLSVYERWTGIDGEQDRPVFDEGEPTHG